MESGISSRLSFENYSSQARNNFKKSDEEMNEYVYVNRQINDFYISTKNKQGFIGKIWDKIKCFLNLKTSSKNTEEILNKHQNNLYDSSSEASAIIAMNDYAQSQETALNASRNFVASSSAGFLFSFLNKHLKNIDNKQIAAILALSSLIGATLGIALKAIDAKSANRKYKSKELKTDAAMGLTQGMISGIFSFSITNFIGNKLNTISRMIIKSLLKLSLNTSSAFSVAMMETKITRKAFKLLNPQQYETMMNKVKEQEKMDEYQFYNPRYELINAKSG